MAQTRQINKNNTKNIYYVDPKPKCLSTDTITVRIGRRHQFCTRTDAVICGGWELISWGGCSLFTQKQVMNAKE